MASLSCLAGSSTPTSDDAPTTVNATTAESGVVGHHPLPPEPGIRYTNVSNESAVALSGRTTRGNVHLKTALVEAATAAARTPGYLKDKFYRLKARRGYKRAALAVAHKILVAAYHMLSTGVAYHDLGEGYLDRVGHQHVTRNLVRRLERLGYHVQIEKKAA